MQYEPNFLRRTNLNKNNLDKAVAALQACSPEEASAAWYVYERENGSAPTTVKRRGRPRGSKNRTGNKPATSNTYPVTSLDD